MNMNGRLFFKELLDFNRTNAHALALKLNKPALQSTFQRFLDGTTKEARRSTFEPVADYFRVSLDAFYKPDMATSELRRIGAHPSPELEEDLEPNKIKATKNLGARANGDERTSGSSLIIRQFNTGGSMGRGVVLQDQPGVIQSMEVTQEWVQKNIRNFSGVSNLAVVTGFGDSMKPLYNSGDPLLVDRAVTEVRFEAIYFFRVGDEGFVKRLQRIPGKGILVISDNEKYRDWLITKDMDFEVFARVIKVWCGEDF